MQAFSTVLWLDRDIVVFPSGKGNDGQHEVLMQFCTNIPSINLAVFIQGRRGRGGIKVQNNFPKESFSSTLLLQSLLKLDSALCKVKYIFIHLGLGGFSARKLIWKVERKTLSLLQKLIFAKDIAKETISVELTVTIDLCITYNKEIY